MSFKNIKVVKMQMVAVLGSFRETEPIGRGEREREIHFLKLADTIVGAGKAKICRMETQASVNVAN